MLKNSFGSWCWWLWKWLVGPLSASGGERGTLSRLLVIMVGSYCPNDDKTAIHFARWRAMLMVMTTVTVGPYWHWKRSTGWRWWCWLFCSWAASIVGGKERVNANLMCQLGMVVVRLEHVWGQVGSSHEECPCCLQVATSVLQDSQVVVGLTMVIVWHQG